MKGQKTNVTEKETVLKKSKSKLLASVASGLCGAALIAGSLFAVGCSDDSSDKVKYVFNTMGGASISDVEVDLGAEYTLPVPEQREGFLFEGWYTTETFDGFPVTIRRIMQSGHSFLKSLWSWTVVRLHRRNCI